MPVNPVETLMNGEAWTGDWNTLADKLIAAINKGIERGQQPSVAVAHAWHTANVPRELNEMTTNGIVSIVTGGGVNLNGEQVQMLREYWLNEAFDPNGLSLSARTTGAGMQSVVANEIHRSMRDAESWTQMARSLNTEDALRGDISKTFTALAAQGRRAFGGDAVATKAFTSELNAAKRQIERLAQDGAPTEYLKKAYANVIKQVERGKQEAIDKAIERAVNAKMRYNAERIARTEMARAYGKTFFTNMKSDPDVLAWRWVASGDPAECEECATLASTDAFGMGEGVYPLDSGPEYPAHPHCLCFLEGVYELPEGAAPDAPPDVTDEEAEAGADAETVTAGNEPLPEEIAPVEDL
jgi:SPP1 gp7 family putative phage head morphogenesis protein